MFLGRFSSRKGRGCASITTEPGDEFVSNASRCTVYLVLLMASLHGKIC